MVLEDLYRLLRSGHVQAQGVVDTIALPVVVLDQSFCVATANNAFLESFKVGRDDVVGESFFGLGDGQWDIPELRNLVASVIPKAAAVIGFEVQHNFPVVGQRTYLIDMQRLVHPDHSSSNILISFDDVTERQRQAAETESIISETRHRMQNLSAVVRALAMKTETRAARPANSATRFLVGWTRPSVPRRSPPAARQRTLKPC
ncbi:PAS domain-containing protein [Pseudorhizobium xiangyangii]|uniref:PAS domain-containing protein n=1 Tax=Pseudorhizobium xiangyangii TaxID=2883104 RepID=UPI0028F418F1|nr:PAS domain-containing protein [Neorhizobium xiangyangii]